MNARKTYILDTNIFLYDPQALSSFKGAELIIHGVVLDELETLKTEKSERGYNAREIIRSLDSLREEHSLREGAPLSHNSIVRVHVDDEKEKKSFSADEKLIALGKELLETSRPATLMTKDFAMRIKASLLGIPIADYQSQESIAEQFYRGWKKFEYPGGDIRHNVNRLLSDIQTKHSFTHNEFALLHSCHKDNYYRIFRFNKENTSFTEVSDPDSLWQITGRNPQQTMLLNLLLDDSVKLITLFGPSGTGKTFLVLAAMLYKILVSQSYQKLLISRPIVPLGNDIGYLPGDLQEKLDSWMQPIKDNLELLIAQINQEQAHSPLSFYEEKKQQRKKRFHKRGKYAREEYNDRYDRKEKSEKKLSLEGLISHSNKISLEAITYMRGRSIPFQVIFIDEVQNLTPHEVKTLISRAGEGTKVVLVGDPHQIDSPYLDALSNGLVVASKKFKGESLFGSIYLEISERSELSELVNSVM